ncbi:hypothetical protein ACHAWU_003533 [Discostella pseudostelligera]|uniref:Uncharacterized protein n=1 Tax=Discostella pseudostelligera TaxID=259834 RepID=A0ABD3LYG2_9STRA
MSAEAIQVSASKGMVDQLAMDEELNPRNVDDANVTITLLELSGVSYHKRKDNASSHSKKSMGRLPRVGKKPTSADVKTMSVVATSTPTPAVVVVWLLQNETTIDTEATPSYICSSPMVEEAMDDEGNVFSWRCAWPDASLIHGSKTECIISLGVGLQLPGINEIQPLGVATVRIPEDTQSESDRFLSVHVTKQRTRQFGSRIGMSKDCEYTISPSTILKIKLHNPTQQMKNDREFDPAESDAKSVASDEQNTPLALLMWGSQSQGKEECTGETGSVTHSNAEENVAASDINTTAECTVLNEADSISHPSPLGNDQECGLVSADTMSVVPESSVTPPLALLMWGSKCQDEEEYPRTRTGSITNSNMEQSPNQSIQDYATLVAVQDNDTKAVRDTTTEIVKYTRDPQPSTLTSSEMIVPHEHICDTDAIVEQHGQSQISDIPYPDPISEYYLKVLLDESLDPGHEMCEESKHVQKEANQQLQATHKRSTEPNPQPADLLSLVKQNLSICGKKLEEAVDNAGAFLSNGFSCGDLFDEVSEEVESNLKKTHNSWKKYLSTQMYQLSKAVSFGSTQCSEEESDASFSSQSTEAERRTERLMTLLRRGSAKRRSNESNRNRIERRFIRLPLSKNQTASGYRLNRNVSVCSV